MAVSRDSIEVKTEGPLLSDSHASRDDRKGRAAFERDLQMDHRTAPYPDPPAIEGDSPMAALCKWVVEHQIGIASNLLVLLFSTHVLFPKARTSTQKFFRLSYLNADTAKYGAGWDDAYFVMFWVIAFFGIRVTIMEYILFPLADLGGIRSKSLKIKFVEQAWVLVYDTATCSLGFYIMYNSDYWLNLPNMWTNWPDREMDGLFKWYYLVQFAFWLQQLVVVNIETRRKDHMQMFSHHVVTSLLMFWSYGYRQTKVGNVILCIMDGIDTLLAFAKVLKYLRYSTLCDIAFGIFMLAWFLLRHLAYLAVCWSILVDVPEQIKFGCYRGTNADMQGPMDPPEGYGYLIEPFRDPKGLICQTMGVTVTFLSMLLLLQIIMIIWFGMILNVAWKVVTGKGSDDPRSDDEDEGKELDEESFEGKKNMHLPPVEEEVGVEELNFGARRLNHTRVFKKGSGSASGVSLAHDRKELLGRIGCDKQA